MYPQQSIVKIEGKQINTQYLGPQTVANMAAAVVDPILKFVVFGILLIPGKFIDTSNIHCSFSQSVI